MTPVAGAVAVAATVWISAGPCPEIARGGFDLPAEWNGLPRVTHDRRGRPGDPVNIAIAGGTLDVLTSFAAAGWYLTSRGTLGARMRSVGAYALKRPYSELPVSHLWLMDRPQDLAFAKPVGHTIDRRHHVRLWRTTLRLADGRPVWLGAASFDVGMHPVSVLHRIAPEVDLERDAIVSDLASAGMLAAWCRGGWMGPTEEGHNAAGDMYCTDGAIAIAVLNPVIPTTGEMQEVDAP